MDGGRKPNVVLAGLGGIALLLAVGWGQRALGFSNDGAVVVRRFDRTVASTNSAMTATVIFTNAGSAPLRGFWYADQLPTMLSVTPIQVTLNGRAVTNLLFETGQDGDVYSGCTPYRWVLEQPAGFAEANPIPPGSVVRIAYSITSSAPGSFILQQFTWTGYDLAGTNSTFGYSESLDEQIVSFLATPPARPSLYGQRVSTGFQVDLTGQAGAGYVLQASSDLAAWQSLATNASPFSFLDTNAPAVSSRYYRAVWLP